MDPEVEKRFIALFEEELSGYPVALQPSFRGPDARGGRLLAVAQPDAQEATTSANNGSNSSLNTAASREAASGSATNAAVSNTAVAGNGNPTAANNATPAATASDAADEYWDTVSTVLRKHLDEQKTNLILRVMMREHLDYVKKLSLDEIELLAGDVDGAANK